MPTRKFIDGSGADSTAAVIAYLNSNQVLFGPADLYVIKTAPQYAGEYLGQTFLLTDYGKPLIWAHRGVFSPGNISRSEVESKIGLEAGTLDVTWSPQVGTVFATAGSPLVTVLTVLQAFQAGIFDNGTIELWRCIMPTDGDCNTLGATLMFSGRIGKVNPERLLVKFTATDRRETLNQQIPTNLIEPGDIAAEYSTGVVPPNAPTTFTILSGSTAAKIIADPVAAPGGYTPADGLYDTGYIVMASGTRLGGSYQKIRRQTIESAHHVFYLQRPLPFAPSIGDTFDPLAPASVGYSLLPFNNPFPATQTVSGDSWVFGLNGTTITAYPNGSHNVRTYGFMYHAGTTDVYHRTSGGTHSGYSIEYLTINASGTAAFLSSPPAQDEIGGGTTEKLIGFPFVPVAKNSPSGI